MIFCLQFVKLKHFPFKLFHFYQSQQSQSFGMKHLTDFIGEFDLP